MINLAVYISIFIISVIIYLVARKKIDNDQIKKWISLEILLIPSLFLIANQIQNMYLTFNFQIIAMAVWFLGWTLISLTLLIQRRSDDILPKLGKAFVHASFLFLVAEIIGLVIYILIF